MERKTADDYPQEVLDLFHEYQHGDMERRTFMASLGKFAVGGLTAVAIFESLQPNYAWAQTVPKDDKDIKVGYETVDSPAGNGTIKGYLAKPAKGKKFQAVLVIHENRGLNPYIEDVARRLAKAGYIAFAPDGLTSVGGYPGDEQKGAAAFRTVDGKKMTEDFVTAALWLKKRPDSKGKLGAVGFCFGGGMVNTLAYRLGKDLNAGVPFYGRQAPVAEVPKIMAPLMFQYAGNDAGVNAGIAAYEAALTENKKKYESFKYEGKQHGFHNDTTPRYDAEAAKLAWERTLAHFKKHLK
ncbi:MAG: dienelactone hydrolase family protein [Acidobacteria bacterium]|nr:dienelactone hydrolase family protein [Acidobacteriota bacterium]MBP7474547.1 dienelactone hydrolase family protein [Pyrinomonadaceae bacterium]MBP9110099.1 dienelactone hydrolase family protein [Pyrinomonadaceae bacterium]